MTETRWPASWKDLLSSFYRKSLPTSGLRRHVWKQIGGGLPSHPISPLASHLRLPLEWETYLCSCKAPENLEVVCYNSSVQFSSVAQSGPTLCNPMNRSTPGLPVHHQLPEFTQTHIYWVGDAIQPSHPLSFPSPPAPNPSQHQSPFQWVNSSHEVTIVSLSLWI